ncbi:MAG: tRNA 4-thiouridine(8) synthase ThiI [Deltaproteobacteria bacterium]|nr:tRNA 4-thiouridine(8) synthase ThiI [Deltaproteobacteria bacterium]MBW2448395.1 tRNA 4-thiouridine(8) synthase ThiI [Deltaproteobacteria bacterium]
MILLRFSGDLSTKSRATWRRMVDRLVRNLEDALASEGIEAGVRRTRNRIYVEADTPEAADVLGRVFGLQSLSPLEERTPEEMPAIVAAGEALFRERVAGRRFAVRARRVGGRRDGEIRSVEVERELGAALLPHAAGVDLGNPEVVARVELCEGEAYLFGEHRPAPGGLPLGVEGRAVALVSGGFDSAVAAWHMLKRGVSLDHVFCNLGGASHELGTLRVMKEIADHWSYGDRPIFHGVDFAALLDEIRAKTEQKYWQILLKRLMLRAAEAVAVERRCAAIVTGEAIGQVSSQTLTNLGVISQATRLPILRPLVTCNKEEIIAQARTIGTYDLSKVVGEYCAIVPRRPATSASLGVVLREEEKIDLSLLEVALAERRILDLRDLSLDALALPELETTTIPAGAVVIALQPKSAFAQWHWPDAARLDFAEALRVFPSMDKSREYALYCEFGLMSAHLAEMMQREGLNARHIRGGLRAVKNLAATTSPAGPEGRQDS